MSSVLFQIVMLPLAAAVLVMTNRSRRESAAGWITIAALVYTTVLLLFAGWRVATQGEILERYTIGPDISLNLLADGLSLPVALVINLICLALASYSLHYVSHRIDILYPGASEQTRRMYFRRFFFLYLFFPAGFMGVAFSTNLISIYLFLELLTIIPLYFIMAQFGYSDYITRYKVALMCLHPNRQLRN
jgi:NADH-quinone oxidoreductase subunit M